MKPAEWNVAMNWSGVPFISKYLGLPLLKSKYFENHLTLYSQKKSLCLKYLI